MNPDELPIDRRRLLGTVGAGVAAGIAGCLGEDAGDDPEDAEDEDDHEEETSADEAAAFPEGLECVVCNMIAEEYPEWNAQLIHENGERVYFCSSGCMAAYYVAPEAFDGLDEEVTGVWVTDFGTEELIDAMDAYFVLVADPEHVDDIMMMNPTPFAERDDAEAFVDELNDEFDAGYDHETDIVTLEEFGMELAMMYRSNFLDGDGHGGHDDEDGHDHDDEDGHDHDDEDGHDHDDEDGHDHDEDGY